MIYATRPDSSCTTRRRGTEHRVGIPGRAAEGMRNPVACQTNAWQIKAADFPELLRRLADLKRLGFEAFECNVRFVKDQFVRSKEARAQIEATGVRFYGPHVGLRFSIEELEPLIDGSASLGATRFALSGAGKPLSSEGRLDPEAFGKKVEAINTAGQAMSASGSPSGVSQPWPGVRRRGPRDRSPGEADRSGAGLLCSWTWATPTVRRPTSPPSSPVTIAGSTPSTCGTFAARLGAAGRGPPRSLGPWPRRSASPNGRAI